MPQYIRPSSDLTRSDNRENITRAATAAQVSVPPWTPAYWPTMVRRYGSVPDLSTGTSVSGVIDEVVVDDADYIESVLNPIGDVLVVETGDPATTPSIDRNHFVRVRCAKNSADGQDVRLLVELRQGYTAESGNNPGITNTMGTLIARFNIALTSTITTYRRRLTTTEAALITSYTDLQLRFIITADGGSISAPAYQTAFEAYRGASLNEVLDSTETGVDVVDGTLFAANDVIQIDAEIMTIDSVASNTLTVTRAARSTTGAAHGNGAGITFVVPTAGRKTVATGRRTGRIYWAEIELPSVNAEDTDYTPSETATEV